MKTVWKYPILADDYTVLKLPIGSTPLTVQVQGQDVNLWVLVDPEKPVTDKRVFRLAGTGHLIEERIKNYIGTVQVGYGLVFHLFEIDK